MDLAAGRLAPIPLAKRIGLDVKKPDPVSERSESLAQMMLDAINNLDRPLTLAQCDKMPIIEYWREDSGIQRISRFG